MPRVPSYESPSALFNPSHLTLPALPLPVPPLQQLSERSGVHNTNVKNVIIWGNHSSTQVSGGWAQKQRELFLRKREREPNRACARGSDVQAPRQPAAAAPHSTAPCFSTAGLRLLPALPPFTTLPVPRCQPRHH